MTDTTDRQHEADAELKTAIASALQWSPAVNANHIGVSVTQGAVQLSGQVLTYPEKTTALQVVLGVRGVTAVADDMSVQRLEGAIDDADIARSTTAALSASTVVQPGTVKATVKDRWVTLSGDVHWNFQRETSATVVGGVIGVAGVRNDIEIKPSMAFAARTAKTAVKAALVRSALTESNSIDVLVHGTELELIGTVRSWQEYREAGDAAWATPGVTHVGNKLTVVVS